MSEVFFVDISFNGGFHVDVFVIVKLFNSRRQPLSGFYLEAFLSFNSLYLFITFLVLHRS